MSATASSSRASAFLTSTSRRPPKRPRALQAPATSTGWSPPAENCSTDSSGKCARSRAMAASTLGQSLPAMRYAGLSSGAIPTLTLYLSLISRSRCAPRPALALRGDDARALDELCERDRLEHRPQHPARLEPDARQRLGAGRVDHLVGAHARDGGDRAVDHTDHLGQRDLVRGDRQAIAALRPALRRDDPGVLQLAEDVLDELQRQLLGAGDELALDRALSLVGRQHEHRAHRVVGLGGQLHRGHSRTPAVTIAAWRT